MDALDSLFSAQSTRVWTRFAKAGRSGKCPWGVSSKCSRVGFGRRVLADATQVRVYCLQGLSIGAMSCITTIK